MNKLTEYQINALKGAITLIHEEIGMLATYRQSLERDTPPRAINALITEQERLSDIITALESITPNAQEEGTTPHASN